MSKLKKLAFKEIERHWYGILKDSGFKDIEDTTNEFRPLVVWHSLKWNRSDPGRFKARQDYYTQAVRFLSENKFESDEEKLIWLMHSEGMSVREIEAELCISRNYVHKIIVTLREVMRSDNEVKE